MARIIREESLLNERLMPCKRKVVACDRCGREVLCYAFTNGCECGALYNMSGQSLNPPHMWEEPYEEEEGLPGFSDDDFEMRERNSDR